jgi:hypothetical protein
MSTQKEVPEFKTGIYQHFKGKLYFLEGLELDADSNEDRFRVRYWALYPGQNLPFSQSFEEFSKPLAPLSPGSPKRFSLVRELPAEKMRILLPGSPVEEEHRWLHHVEKVGENGNGIFIQFKPYNNVIFTVGLEKFLQKYKFTQSE